MNEQYAVLGAAVLGVLVIASLGWWWSRRKSYRAAALRDMTVHVHVDLDNARRLFGHIVSEVGDGDSRAVDEQSGDDGAMAVPADAFEPRRFVVDSLTLLTTFRYLLGEASTGGWPGGFREVFAYLSSVRINEETFILTNLLPVRFAEQSAAGVKVDQASNIETFTALDRLGLTLGAHVHSHPGQSGPDSTYPSETDRRFQARLEQGGCAAIGLIFARSREGDGYVRFFAGEESRFMVEVQGAFVERVDEYVFRLSLDDGQLPINTVVAS